MAVFGVQVVITMIVASVVHKLSPYYSFGRWFITKRLRFYSFVTSSKSSRDGGSNEKSTSNRKKSGRSHQKNHREKEETMTIEECLLTALDLLGMHYSVELKWMLDLLMATFFIFVGTTIYFYVNPSAPHNQMNLSAIWVGFLLLYTIIILFSLMKIYLAEELPKERLSQIVISFILVTCCMIILLVEEDLFDFKITKLYQEFVIANSSENEHFYFPMWTFKLFLGIASSCLGALIVFPSLNFTRIHFEALKTTKSFLVRSLLNISFISPLICVSLWLKATGRNLLPSGAQEEDNSLLSLYKIIAIFTFSFIRFVLFGTIMQAYLNRAKFCLSNMQDGSDATEASLKRKVTSIFSFYCCSAIQYLGPVILLMTSSLLYIMSSHYFNFFPPLEDVSVHSAFPMFNLNLFQGSLSFIIWWICFCMFIISSVGSVVHSILQSYI